MSTDPSTTALREHQAWLGYLQPEGLVVSAAALVEAQAILNRANAADLQQRFIDHVISLPLGPEAKPTHAIRNLRDLLIGFLGWPGDLVLGTTPERPVPEALKVPLRDFGETLEPSLALLEPKPANPDRPWQVLVQSLPQDGADLDVPVESAHPGWAASPTQRFERLLRETGVPIGLLSSATHLRLIYAPHGENSGHITFPVAFLAGVPGRPALAALVLLLSSERLVTAATRHRLPAILRLSREMQASVSTRLADQILGALYELLRGFHSADTDCRGALLAETLASDPQQLYNGLLTVLMRLVFLLYAEDRGLMPGTALYTGHYSVHGLARRLQSDAERFPDTMDHRYGAWPQLVALFRTVYKGCTHPDLKLPQRLGHLFDPDHFPFLEGRTAGQSPDPADCRLPTADRSLPLIPDGFIHRALRALLLLDGERLSYRTLDVEQIGSVYSAMMGFHVSRATGATVALRPGKAHGAPVPVDLDGLLALPAAKRSVWLDGQTDYKAPPRLAAAVRDAQSVDDLLVALDRRIARNATPHPLAPGTPILIPTDERRASGSHYTPRSLTQPIVEKALAPILQRLGDAPAPDEILALKVCDPAMGSGAFLVESCRQLAAALEKAWKAHGITPVIPPDEDIVLYARRVVAQRCLYGVDRNPMATDLAKLSLWLATLAKDHAFTFLDHSLRTGDTLVGLSRQQIEAFHWDAGRPPTFIQKELATRIEAALRTRRLILDAGDFMLPGTKAEKLASADDGLQLARDLGDACISAFFSADKPKAREQRRGELLTAVDNFLTRHDYTDNGGKAVFDAAKSLRAGAHPTQPFHWEIEYPEVFSADRGGFDSFVGNPPFAGKNTLLNSNREGYVDWLQALHAEAHGNADLVAHFYRRAFNLLRTGGTFGLIATNTIGQGDTRQTGLRWICTYGGTIYSARKRVKWPGEAAVVVSVVHVGKEEWAGTASETADRSLWRLPEEVMRAADGRESYTVRRSLFAAPYDLDSRTVDRITAYLFHAGGHETPAVLKANDSKSFIGSYVLGMGFTFDDTDTKGVANPLALMRELIDKDPRNAERIFPYIGGEEINDSPVQAHHRYVINFADFPLRRDDLGASWSQADEKRRKEWIRSGVVPLDYPDVVAADWPDLLKIVEEKVKPERQKQTSIVSIRWWYRFARPASDFVRICAVRNLFSVLAISRIQPNWGVSYVDSRCVFAETDVLFALSILGGFAVMQSRTHEMWARFHSSSMKDDMRYAPTDCFETFPFPPNWESNVALEAAGSTYYDLRAALMKDLWIGLTETYNLFHAPDHEALPQLQKLFAKRATHSDWRTSEKVSDDCSPFTLYPTPDAALAAIIRLREFHADVDRAVLDAYGWTDIPTDCEFILDYEEDGDDGETGGAGDGGTAKASRRKKPWRYRWPDPVRDEVLARLLALNAERAEEERLAGTATNVALISAQTPRRKKVAKLNQADQTEMDL